MLNTVLRSEKKDKPLGWEIGVKSPRIGHLKNVQVFEAMKAILCDRDSLRATGRLI